MSVFADKELLAEVVALASAYFPTAPGQRRDALEAVLPASPILGLVDYSGAPLFFHTNVVLTAERHGSETLVAFLSGIGKALGGKHRVSANILIARIRPANAPVPVPDLPAPAPPFFHHDAPVSVFTGRESLVADIADALLPGARVALTGVSGIGKSQIARAVAERVRDAFPCVLVFPASDANTLAQTYRETAWALGVARRESVGDAQIREIWKSWFATHTGWLVVYDSADNPEIWQEFDIPDGPGAVIVTTRVAESAPVAQTFALPMLTETEAATLLLRAGGHIAPDAALSDAPADAQTHARALIGPDLLGRMPGALVTAGAYLAQTRAAIAAAARAVNATADDLAFFHDYFASHRERIARRAPPDAASDDIALSAIVGMALGEIERTCRPAAELLRFCAFLGGDDISERFLAAALPVAVPSLAALFARPHADVFAAEVPAEAAPPPVLPFAVRGKRPARSRPIASPPAAPASTPDARASARDIVLRACADWFLLRERQDSGADGWRRWSFHPRAQAAVRATLSADRQRGYGGAVLRALIATFPVPTHDNRLYRAHLFPQIPPAMVYADALSLESEQVAFLLTYAGLYASEVGANAKAEPLLVRALSIFETQMGAEHPYTAMSLNNLALLYGVQGAYDKSERLLVRAMAIKERQIGVDDPNTATTLENLATILYQLGDAARALPLLERALAIQQTTLGVDHPKSVDTAQFAETVRRHLADAGKTAGDS